jgi:hypothetical protein
VDSSETRRARCPQQGVIGSTPASTPNRKNKTIKEKASRKGPDSAAQKERNQSKPAPRPTPSFSTLGGKVLSTRPACVSPIHPCPAANSLVLNAAHTPKGTRPEVQDTSIQISAQSLSANCKAQQSCSPLLVPDRLQLSQPTPPPKPPIISAPARPSSARPILPPGPAHVGRIWWDPPARIASLTRILGLFRP